jgi:hypothetical protein
VPAFPVRPDDLTAPWLTEQLRGSGALERADVRGFSCAPVDPHDGMTGVLVRLRLDYDVTEPDAPATLVAKFSAPKPAFRAMVHSMGFFEREVHFYSEFAADVPVRVPRCHFAGIDESAGWSLLLLEDLAPARNGSWSRGSSLAELQVAVAAIAAVHAAWWRSPRLDAGWLAMTGFLAADQMQEVVAQHWAQFESRLSGPVTPAITESGRLATRHLRDVCHYLLHTPPCTLVHHDFDGDNLFFPEVDGQMSVVVLDWQLATRAHAALDVGWLIGGQCEPEERRAWEHGLLQTYHRLLVEQGVSDYPFDQCWDDYRLSMLVAIGRVSGAVGLRPPGPPGGPWDHYGPRYAQAVSDLEVGRLVTSDWFRSAAAKA